MVPFVSGASPDHLGTYAVMGAICLMDAVLLAVLGVIWNSLSGCVNLKLYFEATV